MIAAMVGCFYANYNRYIDRYRDHGDDRDGDSFVLHVTYSEHSGRDTQQGNACEDRFLSGVFA